ncbi:MAG: hypothetical protein FGM46_07620 [Ferruginibacter sp.]|nr:hypothetical protein [Ferruginibacter sp.]
MKKTGLIVGLFASLILLASCSTSKQARGYLADLNGTWVLQNVTTEGITGKVKVTVLNEANSNCFNGSVWEFNNNNNLGTYTISQSTDGCSPLSRYFRFSIYEPKDQPKMLQLKRLDSKRNEIDENSGGFRFYISELNKNAMTIKSAIDLSNKPAFIVYTFTKK